MSAVAYLAFRDLVHDRTRSLFSAAGIAAVVTSALLLGGLADAMHGFLDAAPGGANLIVIDSTFVDPGDSTIPAAVARALGSYAPYPAARVSPTFFRQLRVGDGLMQVRAAPVEDWTSVFHITLIDGRLPAKSDEAVVGEGAARARGWGVGSEVSISGARFVVVGVSRSPGVTFAAIWIPMEAAESLFGAERSVQALVVALAPGADARAVRERLEADPVLDGRYAVFFEDAYTQRHGQVWADLHDLMQLVSVLALLAVVLGIFSATGLHVAERARQIGILRAVGFTDRQVRDYLLLRSLALALPAFGLGLAATTAFIAGPAIAGRLYVFGMWLDVAVSAPRASLYLALTLSCAAIGAWLAGLSWSRRTAADLLGR